MGKEGYLELHVFFILFMMLNSSLQIRFKWSIIPPLWDDDVLKSIDTKMYINVYFHKVKRKIYIFLITANLLACASQLIWLDLITSMYI